MFPWCLALIAVTTLGPAPTPPQSLSHAESDSLARAITQMRMEANEDLRTGTTSYFATVLRVDFGSLPRLIVGSAPGCDVRVDDPGMPARALEVAVAGDSFRVAALDPATPFRLKGETALVATTGPSAIALGRWTLRLSHQRYPAIIVFDSRASRRAEFRGLEFFRFDPSYRFVVPLTAAAHPETVVILSTRGNQRRALRVGWFDLRVAGKPCRLEAHRLLEPGVGERSVSIFFRDATTGRSTYPVGRYVDPEPAGDGRWIVDFNQAYNPACAFSPHYNCPIPTVANTLRVAIRAGEKDSHYAH